VTVISNSLTPQVRCRTRRLWFLRHFQCQSSFSPKTFWQAIVRELQAFLGISRHSFLTLEGWRYNCELVLYFGGGRGGALQWCITLIPQQLFNMPVLHSAYGTDSLLADNCINRAFDTHKCADWIMSHSTTTPSLDAISLPFFLTTWPVAARPFKKVYKTNYVHRFPNTISTNNAQFYILCTVY